MIDALRYEWVRLRTIRSTYWLLVVALLFQAIMSGLVAWQLPESGPLSGGEEPFAILATIGASTGVAPLFVAYVIGIVGVLSFGHEYRHGMIRATLAAISSRNAVFLAKALTTAVVAAVAAAACVGVAVVNATIFGVDLPDTSVVLEILAGVVLYTVLFALSGLAFASLLRHQTGAVALLLLVPSVVEAIVRAVVFAIKAASDDPFAQGGLVEILKYLPYDAGGQMYTRASIGDLLQQLGYVPFGAVGGGVVMGVFVGALLALAWFLFRRRDA